MINDLVAGGIAGFVLGVWVCFLLDHFAEKAVRAALEKRAEATRLEFEREARD